MDHLVLPMRTSEMGYSLPFYYKCLIRNSRSRACPYLLQNTGGQWPVIERLGKIHRVGVGDGMQ